MAKTFDEKYGRLPDTIMQRVAGSFIAPSEGQSMSKKEYNEYRQFILDNTTDAVSYTHLTLPTICSV